MRGLLLLSAWARYPFQPDGLGVVKKKGVPSDALTLRQAQLKNFVAKTYVPQPLLLVVGIHIAHLA